ncbi:MAG TPA: hypothetical protein VF543_22500 [Pyrinomonadaceae bacterium]|jgi:hypothetical protein
MAEPESPVIPGEEHNEIKVAEGQAQYMTMPSLRVLPSEQASLLPLIGLWYEQHGIILTRWRLTDEERARVAETGDVYVWLWTRGEAIQPVVLTFEEPQRIELTPNDELPITVSDANS